MIMDDSYNSQLQQLMAQMAEMNATLVNLASQNQTSPVNQVYQQSVQPSYAIGASGSRAQAEAKAALDRSASFTQAAWQLATDNYFNAQTREQEEFVRRQVTRNIQDAGFTLASGGIRVGGEIGMGALGSLVGGLLLGGAGAAVGGMAGTFFSNKIIDPILNKVETDRSLKRYYQDFLESYSYQWINPTESTSKWGMGYNVREQKDIAKFLRRIDSEKFIEDKDVKEMLEGFTSNRLLTSISNVEDFERKFSQLVDVVKTSARVLNKSYKEVVDLMGEYQKMGIGAENFEHISGKIKAAAGFAGINVTDASNAVLSMSLPYIRGSSLSSGQIVGNVSEYLALASQMQEYAKITGNPVLENIVSNMGTSEAMAQSLMGAVSTVLQNPNINTYFAGIVTKDTSGRFALDRNKMSDILSGRMDMQQFYRSAKGALEAMSPAEQLQFQQESARLFSTLQPDKGMQLLESFLNAYTESLPGDFVPDAAFVASQFGIDINTAEMLVESIRFTNSATGKAAVQNVTAAANIETARANMEVWEKERNIFNRVGNFFRRSYDAIANPKRSPDEQYQLYGPGSLKNAPAPLGPTVPLTTEGLAEYEKAFSEFETTHNIYGEQAKSPTTDYALNSLLYKTKLTTEEYLYAQRVLDDPNATKDARQKAQLILRNADTYADFHAGKITLDPIKNVKRLLNDAAAISSWFTFAVRDLNIEETVLDIFTGRYNQYNIDKEKLELYQQATENSLKNAQYGHTKAFSVLGKYSGIDREAILEAMESGRVEEVEKLLQDTGIKDADKTTVVSAAREYKDYFEYLGKSTQLVSGQRFLAESSQSAIEAVRGFIFSEQIMEGTDEFGNLLYENIKDMIPELKGKLSKYEKKLKRGGGYFTPTEMEEVNELVGTVLDRMTGKQLQGIIEAYNINEYDVTRLGEIDRDLLQSEIIRKSTRTGARTFSTTEQPGDIKEATEAHTEAFKSMVNMILTEIDTMAEEMTRRGWGYTSAGPVSRNATAPAITFGR